MRRSLILSAFFTLLSLQSLLSFALVTTQNLRVLDKRGPNDVKASSRTYRSNSLANPYGYTFHPHASGYVSRYPIPESKRKAYHEQKLTTGRMEADHIYEAQMYTHHVENVLKRPHSTLSDKLKSTVKRIINGKKNMALIPKEHNNSKGHMVRTGMGPNGKPLNYLPPPTRHYSIASYPAAAGTAQRLQSAFEAHGIGAGHPTFEDTLHNTYVNAGVLHPAPGTRYQQVGPNHYTYTPAPGTHAYIYPRDISS